MVSREKCGLDPEVLQSLFDHAPVGIAFVDRTFRYVRVNEVLARLNGVTVEAHAGQTVADVVPHLWPALKPLYARALAGETITNHEISCAPTEGSAHTIHRRVTCFPVTVGREIVGFGVFSFDVAGEREAEAELRRSEASLANAQLIAKIGNWDHDLLTGATYWSDQMYEIFAISKTDGAITFESVLERVHPDDRAARLEAQRAAVDGRPQANDYRIVLPDGTIRVVHAIGQADRDADGRAIRVGGTLQDVTDQRRAEAAASRMAAIVESSIDAIIAKDLDGIITSWNKAAERMYGYTAAEIVGSHVTRLIPDDRLGEEERILETIRRGERLEPFDTVRRTKDGRRIDVSIAVSPIYDSSGRVVGASKTARDITERRHTSEALAQSERRLRALAEELTIERAHLVAAQSVAQMGSWATDLRTGAVTWSAETHRIFEADLATVAPSYEQFLSRVHPDDRERVDRAFVASFDSRGITTVDYRIQTPDGRVKHVDSRWRVAHADDGTPLRAVGTVRDVTEQRRIDQALRDSEARLRASMADLRAVSGRLNEAREQERVKMARDIHDHLGQALTALKMDVAEVRRRLEAGDTAIVRERLVEMSSLIDTSVNDVRRVASELRPVVLDDLGFVAAMRAYLLDVERRAKIGCALHTAVTDLTIADDRATALFRILQEALTNVIRHAEATRVDVGLTIEDGWVRLTVRDDGRGIPAEADRNPRALGLVGMRDRALLFGGDVRVSGGPGRGTTVSVELPLAGAPT